MTDEEKYVTLLNGLSPNDLDNNPTSHTGPFSAIAEHIDNACYVKATKIWIDKTQIGDMECLTFRDDGNRLSHYKMLRLFSSGSMRLGKNVIILTKSENDLGIRENQASLKTILKYSPFNTEEELLTELRAIEGPTGNKIIIWNLCRTKPEMELDFTTKNDIRIPCDDSGPESNSSLRAYCSILYLKPSMQINIRGQKVEDRPISESLDNINNLYSYKPDDVTKHKISIGVIGVIECNHLTPTPNKQDFVNNKSYKNTIKSVASKLREYSGKIRNNPSDNVPIEEPNDEMTDEDDESEEPTTPQTSGEGPSGTERPRRNGGEGESGTDRVLRSSTDPTRERELLDQIEELKTKVAQLEEEKDSISEECEQNKASLTELQNRVAGLVNWDN
ncbi:unnamed protein product [Arctogadus glacialis]